MSKFVVVVFPNESKAYEGVRALRELHAEGSLTVYAAVVIMKEKGGNLAIKQASDQGPLGFAVGGLPGGLVGLVGGPAGAAIGAGSGALAGAMADLLNAGVQVDFLEAVAEKMTPGKTAVIEDWDTPLDTRMAQLGGVVIRELRSDFTDAQIEMSIREWQAELVRLQNEWNQVSEDQKAKLMARINEAQSKLREAAERASERMRRTDQETEAKIRELQQQAMRLTGELRSKVEERIAALRAEQQRRSKLLQQAWELTKQALAA